MRFLARVRHLGRQKTDSWTPIELPEVLVVAMDHALDLVPAAEELLEYRRLALSSQLVGPTQP